MAPVESEGNALEGWGVHCVQLAEPCSATQWCHPFSARARGLLGARLVTRYAKTVRPRGGAAVHPCYSPGPGYSRASWVCSRRGDGVCRRKRVWVHGCLCVSAHVCACTYRRGCSRTSMLSRKKVYPASLRWRATLWLGAAAKWLALTSGRQVTTAGLSPLTVTPVLVS
jgi:hypothetical protein